MPAPVVNAAPALRLAERLVAAAQRFGVTIERAEVTPESLALFVGPGGGEVLALAHTHRFRRVYRGHPGGPPRNHWVGAVGGYSVHLFGPIAEEVPS